MAVTACLSTLPPAPAFASGDLALRWAPALDMGLLAPSEAELPPPQAGTPPGWPALLELAARQAAGNRAADAAAEAAVAVSEQARATAWMPRVDANAEASRTRQTINGSDVRTPTRSMTLAATVPLWRAADRAVARAQTAQAEQAAWQARGTRAATAQALSLAFLAAVEAAEQRRLILAQQAVLEEQLRINDRRLQAGAGTVLDVLETRTRLDQSRATAQELTTRLTTQRLIVERLAGQPVALPAGLNPAAPPLPDVVPPLDEALALAPGRSPQWLESRAQTEAAQAVTESRSAERWQPTVDAVATVQRSRQVQQFSGLSDEQEISSRALGVQMNWPLYTGGLQAGRVREAAALLTQAEARHDEARAQVHASLHDAYQSLAQARLVIAVQQQVESTAAATHEAVRKAFVAGMRTNLDLLDAQQQIYAARQNLVSARITAMAAQVNILALLDLLDGARIAPLTAQIEP